MEAVQMVSKGEMYFSNPITQTLISDYLQARTDTDDNSLQSLSIRENEILCLVVDGKTSAEIGDYLHLSPKTVESYRSRMMQKLSISDMPELIKFAIRHGLISVD